LALQRRIIDDANAAYLKDQVETSDPVRIKNALQQLCKLYRQGWHLRPNRLRPMQMSLIALTFMDLNDEKVRRWTLNAFARIGNEADCVEPIQRVLSRMPPDETQTAAAGVAAIRRLVRNGSPDQILHPFGIDPQLQTLAGLQHVSPAQLDLSALPLNVDTASPDYLRLALLVIGLGKSPENMLNPRHTDAAMVKILGRYPDPMVTQYSVWAITENRNLGLGDLGLDLRDIDGQPANVRAWLYQLIGMTPSLADENWGHIVAGSRDGSVEVRSGLILGLRDVYVDGIDDVIFSWVAEEQDREVRDRLYEHMIRQSGKCPGYTEYVVSVYEAEPPGSAVRLRMEANASGTKIFGRFRQIAYNGSGDLFGATSVTNNYHFNGPITGGAVAVGEGNAENEGEVRVQNYAPQTIQTIQSRLEMIEDAVRASALDQSDKEAALASDEASLA